MSQTGNFLDVLRRDGHIHAPRARLAPLNGGVSSEIYLVEDGTRQFVVKRALSKLRVRDDWYADVSRNVTEQHYLECVSKIVPGVVPQFYFSGEGYFAMEYLGEGFANWKNLLLVGNLRTKHAELAGSVLGLIHARTARDAELRKRFDTTANFHQLRVEPYLLTTGKRHPELQEIFAAEAQRIEATREALIHGDFSPKNILLRDNRIVLLDCEVAWFGDPTFDVAFLLTHLFLKSLYHAPAGGELQSMIDGFWRAYKRHGSAEDAARIEKRLAPLLLMLLLARVDGKSPVEYLVPLKQSFIRKFISRHLHTPPDRLAELCAIWFSEIGSIQSIEVNA